MLAIGEIVEVSIAFHTFTEDTPVAAALEEDNRYECFVSIQN